MLLSTFNKTVLTCSLITALIGCSKNSDVVPNVSNKSIERTNNLAAYNVQFEFPAQVGLLSLNGNRLTILYTEKVNFIVNPTDYDQSYSLNLTQDFTPSALAGFDYTTITPNGDKNFNWADPNLNNNQLKGKQDTIVNGLRKIKVMLERDFIFVKEYADANAANNALNALLAKKGDSINFASFYYNSKDPLLPAKAKANITYALPVSR